MKKNYSFLGILLTAMFLLSFSNLKAQDSETFVGNEVVPSKNAPAYKKDLDNTLKDYDLYKIDVSSVSSYTDKSDKSLFLRLKFGDKYDWDMDLIKYDLRSDDYKMKIATDDGLVEVDREERIITYRGFLRNDPSVDVRLTIDGKFILGAVKRPGENYVFFETVDKSREDLDAEGVVTIYQTDDLNRQVSCSYEHAPNYNEEKADSKELPVNSKKPLVCASTPVIFAMDNQCIQDGGGTRTATESVLLALLNISDLQYDLNNMEIDYELVETYAPSGADPGAWTSTTDTETLLSNYSPWAQTQFSSTPRALTTLWTGRGLGYAYAWVDVMCDNGWGHNAVELWGSSATGHNSLMWSHETGHSWGCSHASGNQYVMNPTIYSSSDTWSSGSVSTILATKNSSACLGPCGQSPPSANFTSDVTGICPGKSVQFTDASLGDVTSISWTFTGGTPSSSTSSNPTVTYNTAGTYDVSITATNSFGNDTETKTGYIVVSSTGSLPISEGFEGSFPPTGWSVNNPDGGLAFEQRTDAGNNSSSSMIMNNADNQNLGEIDEIILPPSDFSNASSPSLTFDVAYTMFNATSPDVLRVFTSNDCGDNWTEVWMKTHTDLETVTVAEAQSNDWVPFQTSDWRGEVVDLSSLQGQPSASIKFHNTSGYGTRIWIDNVNISATLDVSPISQSDAQLKVHPNPSNGVFNIYLNSFERESYTIEVRNILGQKVYKAQIGSFVGEMNRELDLSNVEKGVYFLTLTSGDSKRTIKKLIKH